MTGSSKNKRAGTGEDENVMKAGKASVDNNMMVTKNTYANAGGNNLEASEIGGQGMVQQASLSCTTTRSDARTTVTPEKQSAGCNRSASNFFILNVKIYKFEKFDCEAKAIKCKEMMVKHQPNLEGCLKIEEFLSDKEANEYLALLKNMETGTSLPHSTLAWRGFEP
jgi:hypothetical protein